MKIVVIGGTGLIGTRVVSQLAAAGHTAVAASRETGVDSFTGEGLAPELDGAEVLIDVSNSSYTDEAGAAEFFETSTLNLITFGEAAGVRHHVALSVVGTDRLATTQRGYFRAKALQEMLLRDSGRPYSIVHATQFFEFLRSIADAATVTGGRASRGGGGASGRSLGHRRPEVRVADALMQPMAADDVARAVVSVSLGQPLRGIAEFAGPDRAPLGVFVGRALAAVDDPREADPLARYFGDLLQPGELLPGPDATIVATRFDDWLRRAS
ncbi:NmrA family NAD(P)-binding protein [Herbiconiux sp. CPCC 205716]|uniref:NmrA family NAD(P)-binding protein n=1 Tax=Herbiconiux gentiana TaxID=2970912 RepID=A0ABT2GBV0_9MICO|nr:NmrA family NAD(P)-binding protein [Herbiconiux gentiana]MCS5713692.1 NmrA family NAD(P)-binding protein [Herbiconiux gentiana]